MREDNGCSATDSVFVSEDPVYPTFNIIYKDLNYHKR